MGLWHQGIVASAVLADEGYHVVGLDRDSNRVQLLKDGKSPIFEPGLDELLQKNIARKKLKFSSSFNDSIIRSSFVFLMLDTPVDDQDRV